MAGLADIQRRTFETCEERIAARFPADERLDDPDLARFLDRQPRLYLCTHDPSGKARVHASWFLRRDSTFWFPPTVTAECAADVAADPGVAVVSVEESGDGYTLMIAKGRARVVGEREPGRPEMDSDFAGWLQVDAEEVWTNGRAEVAA